MIYAFLTDEAFLPLNLSTISKYSDLQKNNLGVTDDNLVNYFNDPSVLIDPRFSSTGINNRLSLGSPTSSKAIGRILLNFDSVFLNDSANNIDAIIPTSTDTTEALNIKRDILTRLFNVIEYIYMSHDGKAVLTTNQIDTILINEVGSYNGYVAGSLRLSSTVTESTYRNTASIGETFHFYDSYQFTFRVGAVDVSFKIWLNPTLFKAEYPHSTIMQVVFPCEPLRMIHPDEKDGDGITIDQLATQEKIGAVIKTSRYKDEQLKLAISQYDHSGLATYRTRYVYSSNIDFYMDFSILYKGNAPSAAMMREAVRTALIATYDENNNVVATEYIWSRVFPDLFIEAGFYLIPMYFNRINYPASVVIDRNIIDYKRILNVLAELFPNKTTNELSAKMELLQAAGSGLYIVALPVEENSEEYQSLLAQHPTYQNIAPVSGGNNRDFATMTVPTQVFNQRLSTCTKVALGLVDNDEFTVDDVLGASYIYFVSNSIEYHMLTIEAASELGLIDIQ